MCLNVVRKEFCMEFIGWVGFDSFPDHLQTQTNIIIMEYLEEALTLTVLTAMCMYGYLILIVAV